jgi:hypothetical protein
MEIGLPEEILDSRLDLRMAFFLGGQSPRPPLLSSLGPSYEGHLKTVHTNAKEARAKREWVVWGVSPRREGSNEHENIIPFTFMALATN